jgi:uncharacterized protein YggL (DUF469 family)
MFQSIGWSVPVVAVAVYLVTPFVVHSSSRFAARCKPDAVSLDRLPEGIASEFRRRITEFVNLGFELVGTFDCGALANETHSYVAYFCNHVTNEFANVTAMATSEGPASYFEFSARFSNGRSIETNTNGILPLLPANPEIRVFRFESVEEPRALLQLHRQLAEKYAPGLCPLGEPRDTEIQRYVRAIEHFGPRLAEAGYLTAEECGDSFRLTWKGAIRVAWLGLWPMTFLRKTIHRHVMQMELQSLQTRAEAALQKA